jgi:hypothetical protein
MSLPSGQASSADLEGVHDRLHEVAAALIGCPLYFPDDRRKPGYESAVRISAVVRSVGQLRL